MKILRVLLFLLLLSSQLCERAWALTAALRVEEYTDVLVVSFTGDAIPAYTVRRTGPQQITATFYKEQENPLAAIPRLDGASIISGIQPTANGFKILLKTKAFSYVSAPVPGQAQLEIHVFSDPIGSRWVDLSQESLSLAAPKAAKAAKVQAPAKSLAPKAPPAKAEEPAPVPAPAPEVTIPEQTPALPRPTPPEPLGQTAGAPQADGSAKPEADVAQTPDAAPPPRTVPTTAPSTEPTAAEPPPPGPTPVQAGTMQALSLREALALALENNPRISASQGRAEGAELNINSARGAMLPHAQMSFGWTKIANPNNSSESNTDYVSQKSKVYNLQLQQSIFDGFLRLSNYSRAKLLSVRASQEQRKTELDTIEFVQREYFKLIRTRSDIKTYTSSVERLKNQKNAADAFYRLEMAPRLTVLQVETALAQTEQRLSKALSDEQVQLVKLNALLGQTGSPKFDYKGNLMGYTYVMQLGFDDCVHKAQLSLPEVVIAKTDLEIAQEELNIAEGKAYPRVDASASYIKQYTSYGSSGTPETDRKYYTLGLNVAWEFFSGGEQYYEIQSKKKLLHSAQDELSSLMLTVYSYVRESYLNVGEAKNQIRIAMLRRKEANEAYEQASTRFRSGIGTNLDVLDAHEKVTAAESAFSQSQAEFLASLASLYRAMGEKDLNLAMLGGSDAAQ